MNKDEISSILGEYGIAGFEDHKVIDSTNGDDYRLNIIIDRRYVLRVNTAVITEERLGSIDRLAARYRKIGVAAPRLYRTRCGNYILPYDGRICYLSEYIYLPTAEEIDGQFDRDLIQREVLTSIGVLSREFTGVDLSPVNSMWSVIDLAPLDVGVDEKQENADELVGILAGMGENAMAERVRAFNEANRARIAAVYKSLPRCVIQGDLNDGNILIKDGHFYGLIDFNMAGTEVNVNHFCAETNAGVSDDDFARLPAEEIFRAMCAEESRALEVILREYAMNAAETDIIGCYRNICRISQYPNLVSFAGFLKKDRQKALRLLRIMTE